MATCEINCTDINDINTTTINGHLIGDGNMEITSTDIGLGSVPNIDPRPYAIAMAVALGGCC